MSNKINWRIIVSSLVFIIVALLVVSVSKASSNDLSTDKSIYQIGELVLINVPDVDNWAMTIKNQQKTYKYVGLRNSITKFVPEFEGIYDIYLNYGNETQAHSFKVVNKNEIILQEPLVNQSINGTSNDINIFNGNKIKIEHTIHKIVNLRQELTSLSNNTITKENIRVELKNSKINTIEFKDIKLDSTNEITIEEIENNNLNLNALANSFAIEMKNLEYETAEISMIAKGKEIYICEKWNFETKICDDKWTKYQDTIPGQNIRIQIESNSIAFIEYGVSAINSIKPIYKPGETAQILIAVLDKTGRLADAKNVEVLVTDPNEKISRFLNTDNSITRLQKGIYEVKMPVDELGEYTLYVNSTGENINSQEYSNFVVKNKFDFDIIRKTPIVMDPYKAPFKTSLQIIPEDITGVDEFTYIEKLPIDFNILNSNADYIEYTQNEILLKWINIDSKSILEYEAMPPLQSPVLHILGPGEVKYSDSVFYEARPWIIAIDPDLFYDPNSNIQTNWNLGTGTSFTEIDDAIRYNIGPNLTDYLASKGNDNVESEFGFPTVSNTNIENMTLWVYTGTGTNAQYTFYLMQGATERCNRLMSVGSSSQWYKCDWLTPSGDLSDMRVRLGGVSKNGGGQTQNAFVYAAYLEVFQGVAPSVSLLKPDTGTLSNNSIIDFNFSAYDDIDSTLDNCSLYTNTTSSWILDTTLTNVAVDTTINITKNMNDGIFLWNVQCSDTKGYTATNSTNRTITINNNTPQFNNPEINVTIINQTQTVRFNVTVTDYFGISKSNVSLKYPNGTQIEYELSNAGDEFYYIFTDTNQTGTYNITTLWANDSYNQQSTNNTIGKEFIVSLSPPSAFSLLTPPNNQISNNNFPELVWTQTIEQHFKNYTILIDSEQLFTNPDFIYTAQEISNTTFNVPFTLINDTTYYWKVIAYDVFEASTNSTQTFSYETDNTNPSISLLNPSNDEFILQSDVLLNYSGVDKNLFNCSIYGNFTGSWNINESNSSILSGDYNVANLTLLDGFYKWNVNCLDDANNNGWFLQNKTFKIDTTSPVVQLESPANNSYENETNNLVFYYNVSDIMASIQSCSLIIDGEVIDTKVNISEGQTQNFSAFVSNANHNWSINCSDTNGFYNVSNKYNITLDVTVDSDSPIVALNYPQTNKVLGFTNITFNYTPNDATGIENCSIFIDGAINTSNSSINNQVPNYFTINDFSKGSYNWTVECYDNSTGNNYFKASEYYFAIDTDIPNVTLSAPLNNSFVSNNVLFNFTAVNDYIESCTLYGNFSSFWDSDLTNSSLTNNTPAYISKTLGDGSYLWNVLCNNSAGSNNFSEYNFTFHIDSTSPQYSNININPASPIVYSQAYNYEFNITWQDEFLVDKVQFENNFSGTLQNITLTSGNSIYEYNISNLVPGDYYYKWYANDSQSNANETSAFTYTVTKSNGAINLYLDGESNNFSVIQNTYVNITANSSNPLNAPIELYLNNVLINNNTSPLENYTLFSIPGVYNITAVYLGNENYTSDLKNYNLTVNDTIAPNVTLVSPETNSTLGSSLVVMQYNVTDLSSILNCSLYLNSVYNDTNDTITKDITQTFTKQFGNETIYWSINCTDEYNNTGQSQTYNFTVQESTTMNVTLSLDNNTHQVGEYAYIVTQVKDIFGQPITTANVKTDIVDGVSDIAWWNSSWSNRKIIEINETSNSQRTDEIIEINLTGISIDDTCQKEIRLIKNDTNNLQEIPLEIYDGDNSTWCLIGFRHNFSANENSKDYYVYYNTTLSINPSYSFDNTKDYLFYAQTAASDEGAPTAITNVVGFTDGTYSTMAVSGGGAASVAGHGTGFINDTSGDEISSVNVRYRYEIPTASTNWYLRYSADDGGSYSSAFQGTSTQAKITSNWVDVSGSYLALNWTQINRTRLQGRVEKPGGGGSVTLYLYWVQLNVSARERMRGFATAALNEESLVDSQINSSDLNGQFIWNWSSQNITTGNYSIISFVQKESFKNSSQNITLEITPDLTKPTISLVNPVFGYNTTSTYIDFNWTSFDYSNSINCNLSINGEVNISNIQVQNNQYVNRTVTGFDEGVHYWNITCWDIFNNANTTALNNFTIDNSKPYIQLNNPINNYNTSNTTIEFNWSASDTYSPYLECSLFIDDLNVSLSINSLVSSDVLYNVTNISTGFHNWSVNCTDFVGNNNLSNVNNFVVIGAPSNTSIGLFENNSFYLQWESLPEAETYNLYYTDNYSAGFGVSPNVSGITDTNFTDEAYSQNRKYYKISGVRDGEEKLSSVDVGKQMIELSQGMNMISIPFNISNYNLKNSTNNGFEFEFDNSCLVSLWRYSPSIGFERTDWVSQNFVPAFGNEDFTNMNNEFGYWLETNSSCNMTLFGIVPAANISINLDNSQNLVSWHSVEDKDLPYDYEPSIINTNPANSVTAINRYNSQLSQFEVTVYYFIAGVPWGWWPSGDNLDFKTIDAMRAYYFDANETAVWEHEP